MEFLHFDPSYILDDAMREKNRIHMVETLDRMRAAINKCTPETTHAAFFSAAINSGPNGRMAVVGQTGGFDQVSWTLLAHIVFAQPVLPRWKKWIIWILLVAGSWRYIPKYIGMELRGQIK